jgi:hypothetical protein
MATHSLFYFAAEGGERLLRQPQEIFRIDGGPAARRLPFPRPSSTDGTDGRVF